MAFGINKVILVGTLGKDPELREAGSTQVANFSMATSTKYKDEEYTEWHNISVFGKLAEVASSYLSKGSRCYVEGSLKTTEYEKDGVKKYSTNIVANSIQFLDKKAESDEPPM